VVLRLIAILKLAKGLLLLLVGIGALKLLHRDVLEVILTLAEHFNLNPQSRWLEFVVERGGAVEAGTLRELGAGAFVYAALLLTEGVGLWLRRRWAEYFTIIVTGSFIPLEVWELIQRFTPTRLVVLALNVAIVAYLVRRVRRERASL
jgi:uncharacterized membrane protein (DUF2068 family)